MNGLRERTTRVRARGATIAVTDSGAGDPVLLVTGTGASGRTWDLHQVPSLVAEGYRVICPTNRGIAPSDECASGFTMDDLVDDTIAVIEQVVGGPCRVVGTSMGAQILQELLLRRSDLVRQAVLMATRARCDAFRESYRQAEMELHDSGVKLPSSYAAVVRAVWNLSPATLAQDQEARDWLDLFEMADGKGAGVRVQMEVDLDGDRRAAYREIDVPCLVIAFEHDLVTPPNLCREVATAIPGAELVTIQDAGHYGYLEQPAQVNETILRFFAADPTREESVFE